MEHLDQQVKYKPINLDCLKIVGLKPNSHLIKLCKVCVLDNPLIVFNYRDSLKGL